GAGVLGRPAATRERQRDGDYRTAAALVASVGRLPRFSRTAATVAEGVAAADSVARPALMPPSRIRVGPDDRRPAEQRVQRPAAAHVAAGRTAVAEEGRILAAGFFKRVCQDRQVIEAAFVVDSLSKLSRRALVPVEPGRRDFYLLSRTAEDLTQQVALQCTSPL